MDRFIIRSAGNTNPSVSASSQSVSANSSSVNVTSKKRKNDSSLTNTPKKFCDKDYDKNVRVRKFQSAWKITYPWVEHIPDSNDECEGVMFCVTCRAYPQIADKSSALFLGSSNMRIDTLKKHDTSASHIKASEKKKKDSMTVEQKKEIVQCSEIVKAANKSSKINMNVLTVMFNTVYVLAKKGKPLSDYETHMELHKKNKHDIGDEYMDIGSNYLTENSAKKFLMSIAEQLRVDTAANLENCRFLTVLADGSTDYSMTEQYAVLVRYVEDGCPVTKLASMEAIENANAAGVLKGIQAGLSKVGVSGEHEHKVVCANFDGAAVMMGCKSGVSTLMQEKNKYLIPVHCVAHKLELGVLDAVKCVGYLAKFEETVKGIYRFYAKSPKRRRELESIANMLESDLLKYSDVKTVRWVASKGKALRAIENNLLATMGHLEHAASVNKVEEGGKAKKLFNELKTVRFVKYLYLMLDYLEAITATSVKFQKDNLLIMDVPGTVKDLSDELELMNDEPGEQSRKFYKNYHSESNEFQHNDLTVKLTGPKAPNYTEDSDRTKLLSSSIQYLEERFSNFQHKPLKNFTIFDLKNWPTDEKELIRYGREEIRDLCEHFSEILNDEEKKSMLREWTTLKNQLKKKKAGVNHHTLYCDLLQSQPAEIRNILVLINLMVTMSPTTAECERQFSAMKIIKSSRRSHMNQDTLESLMRVHADGPPTTTFNPEPAIHHWMSSGPGTRHLGGHKLPKKSPVPLDVSSDENDDNDTCRDQ